MDKVYIVMTDKEDADGYSWSVLGDDERAYASKKLAQKYINNQVSPKYYWIVEMNLVKE
jgi:hypothetical protein